MIGWCNLENSHCVCTKVSPRTPDTGSRKWRRVKWRYATPITVVHLVALVACLPWLFSWTGVVLAVLGTYAFGLLGMNIGYYRLLTHRSCPHWMERSLAIVLLNGGEGWHSNHHADPRSARHGHVVGIRLAWLIIRFFALLGLADKVSVPSSQLLASRRAASRVAPSPEMTE